MNRTYTYQQVASTTSSRLDQIVMLYDGAIKFLLLAADDMKRKDVKARTEHMDRALAIIDYLRAILDMKQGGEVATRLDDIYKYVTNEIIRASVFNDETMLEGPLNSLREIRGAWHQVAGPQMPAAPAAYGMPRDHQPLKVSV